ncbi:hypothetical protein BKA70DRAFT_1237492 [Coprinopsis sp. MPI-PUGE-AT-0042]|nr:hypothetical protein BKA70DRAFT_1237492 [Coprinopsis sp. MPI-PUGE-AT-0042]
MADPEYDSDNSWAGNEILPGKRGEPEDFLEWKYLLEQRTDEQEAAGSDTESTKQSTGENGESDEASNGQESQSEAQGPSGDQMEVDPESDSEHGDEVATENKSNSTVLELAQLRAKLAAQYDRSISEHCKSLLVRQTLEQAAVKISSVLEMLEKEVGDVGVSRGK